MDAFEQQLAAEQAIAVTPDAKRAAEKRAEAAKRNTDAPVPVEPKARKQTTRRA